MPNNKCSPEQFPAPPVTVSSIVPTDPPPSYKEIFPNNRTPNRNTRNRMVPNPSRSNTILFEKTSKAIFMKSAGIWLFMLVMICIPFAQVVVGAIFRYDCPNQKNIPIYLIVAGVFGLIKSFRIMWEDIYLKAMTGTPGFDPKKLGFSKCNFLGFPLIIFFFCWKLEERAKAQGSN